MITSLEDIRVEAVDLAVGGLTETRVEIFTTGALPIISLTLDDAIILARRLLRAERNASR